MLVDLINFAGDGILAMWTVDTATESVNPLVAIAHMAVQCSLYIHRELDNFEVDLSEVQSNSPLFNSNGKLPNYYDSIDTVSNSPDKQATPMPEKVKIKSHTGLGLGEVKIFTVGGVNGRWLYVVAGNAVEQLTSTVAQAGNVGA